MLAIHSKLVGNLAVAKYDLFVYEVYYKPLTAAGGTRFALHTENQYSASSRLDMPGKYRQSK
jgi:hypothetical protein